MSSNTKGSKPKKRGGNNRISEWFGIPLHPKVICDKNSVRSMQAHTCPFLTEALKVTTSCTKAEASKGVCSISTPGDNVWMVCPYRALDKNLLLEASKKIFTGTTGPLVAAPSVAEYLKKKSGDFVFYFQDKLGGEISIAKTDGSPEVSLDLTFVRASYNTKDGITLHDFGCLEAQTMDFHGSYSAAVKLLTSVLDSHGDVFPDEIAKDIAQDWLSKGIEGPNLANVFKRTFYQAILKFKLAGNESCQGVVLALPKAVWKSWKPHLGGAPSADLTSATAPNTWIFVFDLEKGKIVVQERIQVDPNALLDAAFDKASAKMLAGPFTAVKQSITDRITSLLLASLSKADLPNISWKSAP